MAEKILQSEFEVGLELCDYDSRDDCRADIKAAIESAKSELVELGFSNYKILELFFNAEFLEFDSPNDSHANAMFMVKLHGSEVIVIEAQLFIDLNLIESRYEDAAASIASIYNSEVEY